jgi:exosortase/archaeosortase family protein
MIEKLKSLWAKLATFHSVIIFMLVLLCANLLWKAMIYGDDNDTQVMLFNQFDISVPFNFMVVLTTNAVREIVSFFGYNIHHQHFNEIRFANNNFVTIIWGCTAIKQAFIFLCIMLLTPGSRKSKRWYIPMGLVLVFVFNIIRIAALAMIVEQHREYFHLLHEGLFKYLFYAFIFLIWVIWEEKFHKKFKKDALNADVVEPETY